MRLHHLSKAVAEFHEEFTLIAQQAGLQVSLAVTLRQVEEIEQVAVLEDACRILRQNSRRWCEFLVGQDSSLEGCGFDLTGKPDTENGRSAQAGEKNAAVINVIHKLMERETAGDSVPLRR